MEYVHYNCSECGSPKTMSRADYRRKTLDGYEPKTCSKKCTATRRTRMALANSNAVVKVKKQEVKKVDKFCLLCSKPVKNLFCSTAHWREFLLQQRRKRNPDCWKPGCFEVTTEQRRLEEERMGAASKCVSLSEMSEDKKAEMLKLYGRSPVREEHR